MMFSRSGLPAWAAGSLPFHLWEDSLHSSKELVGNHGGLGGPQREPFLLYPASFDPGPQPIVGAAHLHDVLKGWIEKEQGSADAG